MADRTWKDDQREREAQKRFQENKAKLEQKAAVNWMYNQKEGDAEEFLKGKKIDAKMLVDNGDIAKANALKIFQSSDVNIDNEAFVKFHEDPLTAIKREEMNQRNQVMTNPLQLRQIQKEIDALKRGKKKKHKKDKKSKKSKKKKKRSRSSSGSNSDKVSFDNFIDNNFSFQSKSSNSSDSYERRRKRKEAKAEEKRRRKEEKIARKRQKIKEEEEERRHKEIELLGPDPALYADRTAVIEEQEKLRTGKVESSRNESKKLSKEELALKALEMQKRAEKLDQDREERYNTVLKTDDTREEKKLEKGMKPKFVNEISKNVYVDHKMDLAESINRKKHYTQRFNEH